MIRNLLSRFFGKNPISSVKLPTKIGENTEITGTVDMRSDKSKIIIGNDCLIQGTLVTEIEDSIIEIRDNVFIGGDTIIDCVKSIIIESDVLISYQCVIFDSDNHSHRYSVRKNDLADWKGGKHDWTTTKTLPVKISKGAWIGARVIITKGVTIGEGVIVAAGSVVTKDVTAWTIVAGNPARIVRDIPPDER